MKKKNVLINVVGKQSFGSHHDKIELTTVGSFVEEDTYYLLEYDEMQEQPEAQVHVSVQVRKAMDEVQMKRSGDTHSCLVIKQGFRSQCSYGTQYGEIIMGLFGKKIDFYLEDGAGVFTLRYVMDMNGQVASRNQVKITFKEN